jgi:hypothetical protein
VPLKIFLDIGFTLCIVRPNKSMGFEMYQIEKNVPLPLRPKQGRPAKYPFATMSVGDSFFVSIGGVVETSFRNVAAQAGKRLGRKFSVKKNHDGFRVWRVS